MIQVKIATRLTPTDVTDVRWVLVDPSELPTPDELSAALVPPGPGEMLASRHDAAQGPRWWLRPLQVAVLVAAFGAAWWVADRMIGAPQAGVAPSASRSAG